MQWTARLGSVVLPLFLLGARTDAQQLPTEVNLTVGAYSEVLEPVVGSRIRLVRAGGNPIDQSTDAAGFTKPFVAGVGESFDIHLRHKMQRYGFVLGQTVRGWTVPNPTISVTEYATNYTTTQPTLRPVLFDSSVYAGVQSGEDHLWTLYPDTDAGLADYQFGAYAGSLSTPDSVYRYLDFMNVPAAEPTWRYGFAIRTDGVESFGYAGAVLGINDGALGFGNLPLVDIYFVADSPANLGSSTIEVLDTAYPDGEITVALGGELGQGTTLFLFRPDDGSISHGLLEFLAAPPSFAPPVSGGPGPLNEETQSECEPKYVPPGASNICTPSPPALHHSGRCDSSPEMVQSVARSIVRKLGPRICNPASGGTPKVGGSNSWELHLSATFKLPSGTEVEAGGSWSRTTEWCDEVPTGMGSGCGECVQAFERRSVVCTEWRLEWPKFGALGGLIWPSIFRGCKDKTAYTYCYSWAFTVEKCSIPGPCPP